MPTICLRMAPLRNPPEYQQLAQTLTALSSQHLHKRAEVTAVVIEDLPAARWYVGGRPLERPTAWLEISITAGTNTAEEKAAFIAAAQAALERLVGDGLGLEPASYVVVRELPADSWGYGGVTQAQRKRDRL